MREAILRHRIFQRPRDVVLTDQVVECLWPIFSGEYFVTHLVKSRTFLKNVILGEAKLQRSGRNQRRRVSMSDRFPIRLRENPICLKAWPHASQFPCIAQSATDGFAYGNMRPSLRKRDPRQIPGGGPLSTARIIGSLSCSKRQGSRCR